MGWWIFMRERERSLKSCIYKRVEGGLAWSEKNTPGAIDDDDKRNERKQKKEYCVQL
jgi:hypothetical protein